MLLCCGSFFLHCSNAQLVAVIRTKKASSAWKNRIKVFIRFSSHSLFENRIAVINASSENIAVYPVDITLEIPDAKLTLPAVINFNDYVAMRSAEAKKQCADTKRPKKCSRYVTRFFNHYKKVKLFSFGEIPPKEKRNGYFAFNLPDPFNLSAQSKLAKKHLKNKGRTLKGTIRVIVRTVSFDAREYEFTFPVRVIVSKGKKPKLLRMMKYF